MELNQVSFWQSTQLFIVIFYFYRLYSLRFSFVQIDFPSDCRRRRRKQNLMLRIAKNTDLDDAIDPLIISKIQLTKNEYNASVRNQLEYTRLKIIKRRITNQNDTNTCRMRTSMDDLRQKLDDNQRVIGHVVNRKVNCRRFVFLFFIE